jgi:hypothetical protein
MSGRVDGVAGKGYIAKYLAVQPSIVRAGFARDSEEVMRLAVGDMIKVLEERFTQERILRVRFKRGWASVTAKSGNVLLRRQEKGSKSQPVKVANLADLAEGPPDGLRPGITIHKFTSNDDTKNAKRKDKARGKYRKAVILPDAEIRRREHQIKPLLKELSQASKAYDKWIKGIEKFTEATNAVADPLVEIAVAMGPPDDENPALSSAAEEMVTALQEIAEAGTVATGELAKGIVASATAAAKRIERVKAQQLVDYLQQRDKYDSAVGKLQLLLQKQSLETGMDGSVQDAWGKMGKHLRVYRSAETDMVSEVVGILATKAKHEVDLVRGIAIAQRDRAEAAVESLEVLQV